MNVPNLGKALASSPVVAAARAAIAGDGEAWIVGGAIRDAMIEATVTDVDLAVPGGEEQRIARAIARALGGHAFRLSSEHATWRVVSPGSAAHSDVAALRAGTIEGDLAARDFTINAIAMPVEGGPPIDPLGGLADLAARRLRCASEDAFADDPLRMLRAVRFASAFGMKLDPETARLARRNAATAARPAGERQFAELILIVGGPDPIGSLELMSDLGLTAIVLPELEDLRGVIQTPNHHLDVYEHTIEVLRQQLELEADPEAFAPDLAPELRALLDEPLCDEISRGTALRFGALVHDMGKPASRGEREGFVTFIGHDQSGAELVATLCRRLRTSRALSNHLQALTRNHLRLGFMVGERPLSRRRAYDYLSATKPVAADVTMLTVADRLAARGGGTIASDEMVRGHLELARAILPEALRWHHDGGPRSPVGGAELIERLALEPGPELGAVLEELRAAAFAGEVSGHDEALALAKAIAAR